MARARQRRVAVLGSASIGEADPRHDMAQRIGRQLAEHGFAVATGGYGGLMGAVSRGAAEAGGTVFGMPMRSWAGLRPNDWVSESLWADSVYDRLRLLGEADAVVALPGGMGTLAEAAVTWATRQSEDGAPPLILVGDAWRRVVETLRRELVMSDADFALVQLAGDSEDVGALVAAALSAERPRGAPRG